MHIYMQEIQSERIAFVESCYKVFVSALREANLEGIMTIQKIFPEEYSDAKIDEFSISSQCQLFATRSAAENKLWKQKGSILEIGVASGNHAVSLINATKATSYCGIDMNFAQLSESSKKDLKELASFCTIELIQKDSLNALDELAENHYDSIYIDASHWHCYVAKELELCSKIMSIGGRIILNDYLPWFVGSMEPCGVKRAVNEFLSRNPNWRIDYFAINECDISLVREI